MTQQKQKTTSEGVEASQQQSNNESLKEDYVYAVSNRRNKSRKHMQTLK